MSLLVRLYIWEYMKSLKMRCIGIQTLIKVPYTQLQIIYHLDDLSKSRDIVIYHALKVILIYNIIYLQIRFGGIN